MNGANVGEEKRQGLSWTGIVKRESIDQPSREKTEEEGGREEIVVILGSGSANLPHKKVYYSTHCMVNGIPVDPRHQIGKTIIIIHHWNHTQIGEARKLCIDITGLPAVRYKHYFMYSVGSLEVPTSGSNITRPRVPHGYFDTLRYQIYRQYVPCPLNSDSHQPPFIGRLVRVLPPFPSTIGGSSQ